MASDSAAPRSTGARLWGPDDGDGADPLVEPPQAPAGSVRRRARGAGRGAAGAAAGCAADPAVPWEAHYPDGLAWPLELAPRPLYSLLDEAGLAYADRPCLDFLGRKSSYREIAQLVDRAAKGFQALGVGKGVPVGLFLPNCPYYVICFFAVLKAGGTVVNYNPLYADREIARQIEDSGTSIMVTLNIKGLYPSRAAACRHLPEEGRGGIDGRAPAVARAHAVRASAAQGDRGRPLRRAPRQVQADRQRRQAAAGRDRPARRHSGAAVHRRHDRAAQGRHAEPRRSIPTPAR